MVQSRYIVQAVFQQTSIKLAVSGSNVDKALANVRRDRIARNAICFLFFSRKTGNMVDSRMN